MLKVPDSELVDALGDLVANRYAGCVVKLFKNNYTPVAGDTLANYTEANFSGYADVDLVPDGTAAMSGGVAVQAFDPCVFSHNGGATANDIYGYYVVDATLTELKWAERYASAPATMNGPGQTYTVTPELTLDS